MFEVPGYRDAIERERELRTLIYLDLPEIVCGERVKNITPRLLTILSCAIRSPFLLGGPVNQSHIAQFLWTIHTRYKTDDNGREKRDMCNRVASIPLVEAKDEIDEFIETTFLDSPDGPDTTPYASVPASLVYRFRRDPFRFPKDQTLDTPLRELYQEMKCDDKYNGAIVTNKLSGKLIGDALDKVNTPDKIAARLREELRACRDPKRISELNKLIKEADSQCQPR